MYLTPPPTKKSGGADFTRHHPSGERIDKKDLYHLNLKEAFDEAYIVVRKTPDILDLPTCKIRP